jgi:hypothetical protein
MDDTRPLNKVENELFQHVWAMMLELGEQQRHFNKLQTQYRTLASTWLLATIAAVGLIYSEKFNITFSYPFIVVPLCVAAATGVILLWILDILVYHEILVVSFDEAMRLETKYRWLTQVHNTYLQTQGKSRAVRVRASYFYVGAVILLMSVAGASIMQACFSLKPPHYCEGLLALLASAALGTVGGSAMINHANKRREMAHNNIEAGRQAELPEALNNHPLNSEHQAAKHQ